MLIACKCLNITLESAANNLSTTANAAVLSSNDDSYEMQLLNASNQVHSTAASPSIKEPEGHLQQRLPYLQSATVEKLKGDQLQFFKTVNKIYSFSLQSSFCSHFSAVYNYFFSVNFFLLALMLFIRAL